MASLKENYEFWNRSYRWGRSRGEEWSAPWGGAEAQWNWCIYPRIRQHLPARTILEIGPGHGRWTQFLRRHCQELIVVDISDACIAFCRERFGPEGMRYEVGDGQSLTFLEPHSIDFAFSFESLVHTELEALANYLGDLSTKLTEQGKGFLHHSNLAHYKAYFDQVGRFPKSIKSWLENRGLVDNSNWRAESVSHRDFELVARDAGLFVDSQELVPWGGRRLIDCFSTISKEKQEKAVQVLENPNFMKRAEAIRKFSRLYGQERTWFTEIKPGSS